MIETPIIEVVKYNPHLWGIYWATGAVSKDIVRASLTKILIQKGKLIGCNGLRLHIYQTGVDFQDGLYEVAKRTKSSILLVRLGANGEEEDYPDFESVIYSPKSYNEVDVGMGLDMESLSAGYTRLVRRMGKGVTLSFTYFKDAVVGHSRSTIFHLSTSEEEERDPVYFRSGSCYGVIKPQTVE